MSPQRLGKKIWPRGSQTACSQLANHQSCKKCTKVKISPDLNLRNKNFPNFPHFFRPIFLTFTKIFSFSPVFPHFFLIFSLLSSFFGVFSSFFLYFPQFFLHFFVASFDPLNFPQFPQKYFPIFNFFP